MFRFLPDFDRVVSFCFNPKPKRFETIRNRNISAEKVSVSAEIAIYDPWAATACTWEVLGHNTGERRASTTVHGASAKPSDEICACSSQSRRRCRSTTKTFYNAGVGGEGWRSARPSNRWRTNLNNTSIKCQAKGMSGSRTPSSSIKMAHGMVDSAVFRDLPILDDLPIPAGAQSDPDPRQSWLENIKVNTSMGNHCVREL